MLACSRLFLPQNLFHIVNSFPVLSFTSRSAECGGSHKAVPYDNITAHPWHYYDTEHWSQLHFVNPETGAKKDLMLMVVALMEDDFSFFPYAIIQKKIAEDLPDEDEDEECK